jgi:protein TonB
MMQKTSRAAWKKLSALLILPLLAATLFLLAECKPAANSNPQPADEPAAEAVEAAPAEPVYEVTVTDEPDEEVVDFSLVEVKPVFNDGDVNSFPLWDNKKLQYPEEARENKVEGRVTLQFTVDTDGSVKDVKVLKGVDPVLDSEAVRVISQSPKWTPAMQNGKPVCVHYVIPVIFKLQ